MKPEEKARELVGRFYMWADESIHSLDFSAKKCALIAVEEIIKFGNELGAREPMMYWNKVKEEIEKL